jgi:hypothetical protein
MQQKQWMSDRLCAQTPVPTTLTVRSSARISGKIAQKYALVE